MNILFSSIINLQFLKNNLEIVIVHFKGKIIIFMDLYLLYIFLHYLNCHLFENLFKYSKIFNF